MDVRNWRGGPRQAQDVRVGMASHDRLQMRWRSGTAGRGTKGSGSVAADVAAAVAFAIELRDAEGLSVIEMSPDEG